MNKEPRKPQQKKNTSFEIKGPLYGKYKIQKNNFTNPIHIKLDWLASLAPMATPSSPSGKRDKEPPAAT